MVVIVIIKIIDLPTTLSEICNKYSSSKFTFILDEVIKAHLS